MASLICFFSVRFRPVNQMSKPVARSAVNVVSIRSASLPATGAPKEAGTARAEIRISGHQDFFGIPAQRNPGFPVNVHQSVKITNSVDKYPDYQNGPWLHAVFQKQPGGRQGSNADKRNRDLVAADVSGCPGSDPQGAAQGFHQVIQQGYAAKYNGIFGDFLQPDIQDESMFNRIAA